ncbi:TPR-like protein [Leucogyrophana mollusca]|uniref:TPR-like protein n=1 Tax=Leucogyrophana mollusca TaxID=85980 RepID=A0ACB8B3K6_9AGAM|nr:TPR-like protein [Leucogyrophana mollusca]
MVALTNAIGALDLAKDLVPVEVAKGVLSTLSSILTVVKNTMQNKDDFAEIVSRCNNIAESIKGSTQGKIESEIDPIVTQALSELQSFIDDIEKTVKAKEHSAISNRVFSASMDREIIAKWKEQLDYFLRMCDHKLIVDTRTEIGDIARALKRGAEVQFESNCEPPPPKPSMFFGRDGLVRDAVESLNDKHVVLFGPGGIGKSSIAKAILNEDTIVARFNDRRFFVRFDDINASQVTHSTFIGRIAGALGLRSNLVSSIKTSLGTCEAFLVLDNAETFQDAASDADASRIAETIDELGSLPSVTMMLTTRNRRVPTNLRCATIDVPALEASAARQAFTEIYPVNGSQAIVDKLLSALDFHALSINLLAHVARESQLTLEELMKSWERHQTQLLHLGEGKLRSVSVTIELSLTSSSITKLGNDARHVMQVAAFLPQGINENALEDLFPAITNIRSIVDALCRLSLMYRKVGAYTMLSPIRLHISGTHPGSDISAVDLTHVKKHYYTQLADITYEGDGGAWIGTEDANLERLIAHDLSRITCEDMAVVCRACYRFIYQLRLHKPRPIALRSVILGLPDRNRPTKLPSFLKAVRRPRPGRAPSYGKANCVFVLGVLADDLANVTEAIDLYATAKQLFFLDQDHDLAASCLQRIASQYIYLGKVADAERTLQEALTMRRKYRVLSPSDEADINLHLGNAMMRRGRLQEARVLLASTQEYFERSGDHTTYLSWAMSSQGVIELSSGNCLAARHHFNAALSLHTRMNDDVGQSQSLVALSTVEAIEGNVAEAHKLLQEAFMLATGGKGTYQACAAMWYRAALASDEGDINLARDLLRRVHAELATYGGQSDIAVPIATYFSARNELFAQDYQTARELFSSAVEYCEEQSAMWFQARSTRALGEIYLLENDIAGAEVWFSKTVTLCDNMGIHPDFLYINAGHCKLRESHGGWNLFLEGRLRSSRPRSVTVDVIPS